MSWDVWVFIAPPGLESIDDLPADYSFPPISRHDEYAAAVAAFGSVQSLGWVEDTFSPVDLTDAAFFRVDGPDVDGELSTPDGGSLMLNIRGGSGRLAAAVLEFATLLGARAFDMQSGAWLTAEEGAASFARWAGYRSDVLNRPDDAESGQRSLDDR